MKPLHSGNMLDKQGLIDRLDLTPHEEGGYFRQIHQSEWETDTPDRPGGRRPGINTIYYMLTDDSPIGYFHRNRSDIIHFYHAGGAMAYWTLTRDGVLTRTLLGPDLDQGHRFQLTVPGGVWKASVLMEGTFGLLSEAVAPGFDYQDQEMATSERLRQLFPERWPDLAPYTRAHPIGPF